jgi:hypothetical protein
MLRISMVDTGDDTLDGSGQRSETDAGRAPESNAMTETHDESAGVRAWTV